MKAINRSCDTIAAISTPSGRGGIGIVRLSGERALAVAGKCFRAGKYVDTDLAEAIESPFEKSLLPRRVYYGSVFTPANGRFIDEALFFYMKAPHSYTGQDLVEIQCHGGPGVLNTILDIVLNEGARLAEPGEFTRRAFLNGRIDLSRAEGVIDLIEAGSHRAASLAAGMVRGVLSEEIEKALETLFDLQAKIEAHLDFPEDMGEELDLSDSARDVRENLLWPLEKILDGYGFARAVREGVRIAIAGKPNVGKSSLMNRLLNRDRCIVSDSPGTTRDIVEDECDIRGIRIIIGDTAGLRTTEDFIEQSGVQRAIDYLEGADIVLWVEDPHDESSEPTSRVKGRLIRILNKSDLAPEHFEQEGAEEGRFLPVSAKTGQGMDRLIKVIQEAVCEMEVSEDHSAISVNLRQKMGIEAAIRGMESFIKGVNEGMPMEILAIDLRDAKSALEELLGIGIGEDVLDRIFERFCIGK